MIPHLEVQVDGTSYPFHHRSTSGVPDSLSDRGKEEARMIDGA